MEQPEGSYAEPGDDGQEEQDGEEGGQEDQDDGALGHLDTAGADTVLDIEAGREMRDRERRERTTPMTRSQTERRGWRGQESR